MSTTPEELSARLDTLEKAVQSLLGAVRILEALHQGGGKGSSKAMKKTAATKKRASGKKRAEKAKAV